LRLIAAPVAMPAVFEFDAYPNVARRRRALIGFPLDAARPVKSACRWAFWGCPGRALGLVLRLARRNAGRPGPVQTLRGSSGA